MDLPAEPIDFASANEGIEPIPAPTDAAATPTEAPIEEPHAADAHPIETVDLPATAMLDKVATTIDHEVSPAAPIEHETPSVPEPRRSSRPTSQSPAG